MIQRLQDRTPAGLGRAQCMGHPEGPPPSGLALRCHQAKSSAFTSPAQVRAPHSQPACLPACLGAQGRPSPGWGNTSPTTEAWCSRSWPGALRGRGAGASSASGLSWREDPSRVLCLPTAKGWAAKKGVRMQMNRARSPQLPEMETVAGPESSCSGPHKGSRGPRSTAWRPWAGVALRHRPLGTGD